MIPEEFMGRKTLIIGGLKSGKTKFLASVLEKIVSTVGGGRVTVIDMAPERMGRIGGTLRDYTDISRVNYLRPRRIYAPRTMGDTADEVLKYAEENRGAIKPLLEEFKSKPSEILVINDLTLYLHAGDLEDLIEVMNLAETFIGTAYHGEEFDDKGSGLNLREKTLMKELMDTVDKVIGLK